MQRRIVVSCNVAGRDLGSVVRPSQAAVAEQRVDAGRISSGVRRAVRKRAECVTAADGAGLGVVVGVFMLLVLAFGRPRDALLIMVNLPLALIGGVVGVFLAGGVLSVASMIGFITLFGIATRNGIMLVSHIQHLMTAEGSHEFPRSRRARRARASHSDPDDGDGGGPCVDSVGVWRREAWKRDSDADGNRHSLRS